MMTIGCLRSTSWPERLIKNIPETGEFFGPVPVGCFASESSHSLQQSHRIGASLYAEACIASLQSSHRENGNPICKQMMYSGIHRIRINAPGLSVADIECNALVM
jgi:hypothetical protein